MTIKSLAQSKLRVAMFAGAALFTLAPAAHAAVIVVTPATPITVTNSIDGVYLNVVTGAFGSTAPAGWDINPYNNTAGMTFFTNGANSAYVGSPVSALAAGSIIGPSSTFSASGQVSGSNFQTTATQYFGFRFLNESTSAVNYGWALMSTGATAGFPAAIISYAYEDAGAAIAVPVPEPGSYALMALGLAGVAGLNSYKRRKAG